MNFSCPRPRFVCQHLRRYFHQTARDMSVFYFLEICTAEVVLYTISLNEVCMPGLYVDGTRRYFPGDNECSGMATPEIASEYGPDVAIWLLSEPSVEYGKSVTLREVARDRSVSWRRILLTKGKFSRVGMGERSYFSCAAALRSISNIGFCEYCLNVGPPLAVSVSLRQSQLQ
jgi:hypothetical protein